MPALNAVHGTYKLNCKHNSQCMDLPGHRATGCHGFGRAPRRPFKEKVSRGKCVLAQELTEISISVVVAVSE